MKKDSRQRLFEVMGRLDKTFKPKLNENFGAETEEPAADVNVEMPEVPEVEEKTIEQKYEELKAKVEEMYSLINGESTETEEPADDDSVEMPDGEALQEWNFDKKKGENKKHEDDETPEEEKEEHEGKKDLDEAKPKIPVAAIPKVGK